MCLNSADSLRQTRFRVVRLIHTIMPIKTRLMPLISLGNVRKFVSVLHAGRAEKQRAPNGFGVKHIEKPGVTMSQRP